jgi:hypothetical protein
VESSSLGDADGIHPPSAHNLTDRFHMLYTEGVKKMQRQQQIQKMSIDQDCTFRPKITSRNPLEG